MANGYSRQISPEMRFSSSFSNFIQKILMPHLPNIKKLNRLQNIDYLEQFRIR